MNFIFVPRIFFMNFDFKNGCENNFKDNNEKLAADSIKGFLTKLILKPYGVAAAMTTASELNRKIMFYTEIVYRLSHWLTSSLQFGHQ